eukprot:10119642-Lingulodinium_polyedra.AAC.1
MGLLEGSVGGSSASRASSGGAPGAPAVAAGQRVSAAAARRAVCAVRKGAKRPGVRALKMWVGAI